MLLDFYLLLFEQLHTENKKGILIFFFTITLVFENNIEVRKYIWFTNICIL